MNEQELKNRFPRASEEFYKLNAQLHAKGSEPVTRATLVYPVERERESDARVSVKYVLYRCRLLDPDNAVGATKTLTDCLCAVGLLPGDGPSEIDLTVSQEKVNHKNEQRTKLQITYP